MEQLKTHSRYSEFAGFDEFSLERYVVHRYSSVMGAGAWMCHFLNVAMGRSRFFLLCITSMSCRLLMHLLSLEDPADIAKNAIAHAKSKGCVLNFHASLSCTGHESLLRS